MNDEALARVGSHYAERYELVELLGVGGMGAVYRAKHVFTGEPVALKVMHADVARSKESRKRFLREAKAPSAIRHPGIAKIQDAGVAEDGTLYLAMELLEGRDLADLLQAGAVEARHVAEIGIALLDCLGAAHGAGLVHRDIKPENVFLCSAENEGEAVRLLDFGITRFVEAESGTRLTETGWVLGTPHYMSPEQAGGDEADARSDVYAVGAVLFEALSGRPAFVESNQRRLLMQIVTKPAPALRSLVPAVPDALGAVVDRALRKDPKDRFQTAEEMREALEACLPFLPAAAGSRLSWLSKRARSKADPHAPTVPSGVAAAVPDGPTDASRTPFLGGQHWTRDGTEPVPEPARRPRLLLGGLVVTLLVVAAAGAWVAFSATTTPTAAHSTNREPSSGLEQEPQDDQETLSEADSPPAQVETQPAAADPETAADAAETTSTAETRTKELEARVRQLESRLTKRRQSSRPQRQAQSVRTVPALCNPDCHRELDACRRRHQGNPLESGRCGRAWLACLERCRTSM